MDLIAGITKNEGVLVFEFSRDLVTRINNLTETDFINIANKANDIYHNIDLNKARNFYLANVDLNDPIAIRKKIVDFFGDLHVKCTTYLFAKSYGLNSSNKTNVYFYELTYAYVKNEIMGIYHGAELPFVFGNPLIKPGEVEPRETDIAFSRNVMESWTNFAKYGCVDGHFYDS